MGIETLSVGAITWVLTHSEAELGARLIMLAIADEADSEGRNAWASIERIERVAIISREFNVNLTTASASLNPRFYGAIEEFLFGVRYGEPFVTREVARVDDIAEMSVKSI